MNYNFYTTDVFTSKPFNGARIPVFPNADGLSDHQMQLIANEMNASDTVFIFPDDINNIQQIRVFNAEKKEVSSATHTVLAASHVLTSIGSISLENKTPILFKNNDKETSAYVSGRDGKPGMITMSQNTHAAIDRFVPTTDEIARMLSLIPADVGFDNFLPLIVSCDAPYLVIPIKSYNAVRAARFNLDAWSQSSAPASLAQGILLFSNNTDENPADFHVRLLGPAVGLHDDPPVAPMMPQLANYLCQHEHIQKGTHVFAVQRGANNNRQSQLHLEMDNKGEKDLTVRIGGNAVIMTESVINV